MRDDGFCRARCCRQTHRSSTLSKDGYDKLMEGALRNLHLDCYFDGDEEPCSSRILHFDRAGETMIIGQPTLHGAPLRKAPVGKPVTCSCRLGREILRFSGSVAGRAMHQLNRSQRVPAVMLKKITAPRVIQRRRYFRVSMARHSEAEVNLWVLRPGEGTVEVLAEFTGKIVDLSAGGAGVLIENGEELKAFENEKVWAKVILPGENESLLFRVLPRHIKYVKASQMYHVGLEFAEYIDPGQHRATVEKLVRYVAQRERDELKRISTRRG